MDSEDLLTIDMEMKAFISKLLNSMFKQFADLAPEEDILCICNTIRFDRDQEPLDYRDQLAQLFYLLRFFPAYMAEYRLLFDEAFRSFFPRKRHVSCVSIGCGCGVDLWALYYALEASGRNPVRGLTYWGVDRVAWCRAETIKRDLRIPNAKITGGFDVGRRESELAEMLGEANVVVFAKSLGDLSEEAFEAVRNAICQASFRWDGVLLLAAMSRTSNLSEEEKRLSSLSELLQTEHKLPLLAQFSLDGKKDEDIENVCRGFSYPPDIKRSVLELRCLCHGLGGCRPTDQAECQLGRWPVTKTEHFHPRIRWHARQSPGMSR